MRQADGLYTAAVPSIGSRKPTVNSVLVALLILGPLIGIAWAVAAPPAHKTARPPSSSSSTAPSQPPAAESPLTWTAAQALAALRTQVIARLPGAPAVIDEGRVRAELAAKGGHLLLLPFSGVDTRKQHSAEVDKVTQGYHETGKLVVVSGVNVQSVTDSLVAEPSTMTDLTMVMGSYDVTDLVLTAVDNDKPTKQPVAPPAPLPTVPADPAQVETIARALVENQVYTAPGIPPATRDDRWNRVGPGRTVRIAVLPPLAAGAKFPALAAALAQRFPRDLVAVVFGEWADFAGPDPDVQRTAVVAYYSQNYEQLAEWGPDPLTLGLVLVGEITDQRTRRDAALVTPDADTDPLSAVGAALPWIFTGTVLVLAGGGLVVRRRSALRRARRERDGRVSRARLTAGLTAVAAAIAHLDGLAGEGEAAGLVTRATERYQVARDLCADNGDLPTAQTALAEAQALLASASRLLDVPMYAEHTR
jgi:hypothetical protein